MFIGVAGAGTGVAPSLAPLSENRPNESDNKEESHGGSPHEGEEHALFDAWNRGMFPVRSRMRLGGMRVRKYTASMVLLTALSLSTAPAFSEEAKKEVEPMKMKVGDMAPDFTLLEFDGKAVKPVSLHDFKGKKQVALAFFVFAFTGG